VGGAKATASDGFDAGPGAARLSTARSAPAEQKRKARKMRELKDPDSDADFFFMAISP
jgi:hypothetical protein